MRNVAIMIFPDAELLDFAGPYETFVAATDDDGNRLFNVFTVAEQPGELIARAGMRVTPEYTFATAPRIDILVVPGGYGTRREIDNPVAIDWISRVASESEITTSVCTGSFLLAKAGLLDGRQATTHWGSIARMRDMFPNTTVLENIRWVDAGEVVSSAGVSAGIDMSLHIVERLYGAETAARTARFMEYDYWPNPNAAAAD
ncbi:MAG: AraC family transcriptional regulator [Chloroflexi bacterium]|nr:MAG: AraC family transcriptional regulator [Chloroflexota bacterium]